MPSQDSQEKIDAVLDAALDDLDDDDDDSEGGEGEESSPPAQNVSQHQTSKLAQGPHPPSQQSDSSQVGIDEMMKQLMQMGDSGSGDPDEFMGRFLQEMQSQIGAEFGNMDMPTSETTHKNSPSTKEKSDRASKKAEQSTTKTQAASTENNDVDQAIASLIDGMSKQAKLDNNADNDIDESPGEDEMLKNLMGQLGEGFGDDVNADALIDGMMEQLLSKDLMYEPMKKVTEKFPEWLEQNKGKLPEAEYEQRCKQYKCFQKLVHTYDAEPGNTQTLMLLMQEVQEYGQPPAEIIKDIAPGLELDADGLPKMDGNGGMPFPGGGDEDCRIM